MQEVLSKTADPNVPLQEQEYFELRLDGLGAPFRSKFIDSLGADVLHRFLVCEAHAAWSEIDRIIMWDGFEHDECSTLEEPTSHRVKSLVTQGIVRVVTTHVSPLEDDPRCTRRRKNRPRTGA
jgi:hypothetical protein